ncbi:MAG: type II secretion system F family protein [Candidatus Staskawiczbacteria bacterium]|nr:type II secretion system F family protein [Candidatus Staskawiczbacteria bacterium]
MKYFYQARSKEGKIETGAVEASSKEAAVLLLQKYNIFVTSIKEQSPLIFQTGNIEFLNKVSKKDLAIFSRQLAVMVQSRVPVTQSLKSLALQIKNQNFKEKILKISQLVEEGNSLSDAFAEFPDVFNVFYVSLIKTGEASGKISESLYFLSDHLERESDISSQIKGAMIYPIFVISVLLVVVPIIIFFVMPKLVDLLKQTTAKPPLFTQLMISFYGFLANYGWILLVGFFILVGFIIYYFTTKEGKKRYDEWSLKVPFIGGFFKKTFLVRFAESVSTLVGAGLSINNALKITKDTVGNSVYKKILTETEERVSQGEKISSVLVRYPDYAPPFVVQMIQVGEETGTLDKNLMEIVNFYNKEIKRAVETFTALLEPILIIFLGAGVALVAVSILEPLYGALGTI